MFNKLKPYWILMIHEDQADDEGVPTEVVGYAWTYRGGEQIAETIRKSLGAGKWVTAFPSNWHMWWDLNCGTVYDFLEYDEETATFKSRKIAWWRRRRLWHTLWRLTRGKHSRGAHRATEPEN